MSLKLSGQLFTGPFDIDTTVVRPNQQPVVFAVIAKGGPSWAPTFRVIDIGASPDSGIQFHQHPMRSRWAQSADEQLGIYLLNLSRAEYPEQARKALATRLLDQYQPPNNIV